MNFDMDHSWIEVAIASAIVLAWHNYGPHPLFFNLYITSDIDMMFFDKSNNLITY